MSGRANLRLFKEIVTNKFQASDCHQTSINGPKFSQKGETQSARTRTHHVDSVKDSYGTFCCVGHSLDYESAALPLSYLGPLPRSHSNTSCCTFSLDRPFRIWCKVGASFEKFGDRKVVR